MRCQHATRSSRNGEGFPGKPADADAGRNRGADRQSVRRVLRVCVLQAAGVSDARVDRLLASVNREFAAYGIEVVVPWVRPWQRPGFGHEAMFDDVARRPLESPCDRLVAFADRNAGDFLWGLALPEVLGSVDDATHTRGFVVANRASINQVFMPPGKVAVHEFYHLLGCPHSGSLTRCYERIARLKKAHSGDFFPGMDRRVAEVP